MKCLCWVAGVGRREVEMLMHSNILESVSHLIGSGIKIDDHRN